MSSSKFDTFIKSKPAVSGNITHTRIGDDKNKSGGGVIYGGSYTIPESDMKDFYDYYYDNSHKYDYYYYHSSS